PGAEQPLFELAQPSSSALVGVRNERMDVHPARDGGVQRALDVVTVEAEDDQLHALGGALDRRDQRSDSVTGLNEKLHESAEPGNASRMKSTTTSASTSRKIKVLPLKANSTCGGNCGSVSSRTGGNRGALTIWLTA